MVASFIKILHRLLKLLPVLAQQTASGSCSSLCNSCPSPVMRSTTATSLSLDTSYLASPFPSKTVSLASS